MNGALPWCSPECVISVTKRILGIDPGLRLTGFGIVEIHGNKCRYVTSGVIRIPTGELYSRLRYIFDGINEVVAAHQPTDSAIEKVFVNVNPASTLLLGQARGAAITALASNNLCVSEYTALQVKQAVVGYGKAKKEQVQEMVMRLLSLSERPSTDAADALACAICHANAASNLLQLQSASTPTSTQAALKGLRVKRGRLVAS
jgi:crossover junction endodeoxyribonuclease RuvC